MTLGSRVRFYRAHLGWTLEDLAERSGVDLGTISALENRNSKRSNYAQVLAEAFGLSIEQLQDGSRNWLAEVGASGHMAPITKLKVHEPPAAYTNWPFPDLSEADWQRLTEAERAEVQGFARALLSRRKRRKAAA